MSTLDANANRQAELDAKAAATVTPPLNPAFPFLVAPFDPWFFDLNKPHPSNEAETATIGSLGSPSPGAGMIQSVY